jgi:hypothetical protein
LPQACCCAAMTASVKRSAAEGFNRDWDPDVFVKGAKERILSIDLKKS